MNDRERESQWEAHEVLDLTMIHFPIPETFDSEKLKWPYDGAQGTLAAQFW